MLVAIDIGNSNISIGIFQDATLIHSWRLTTDLLKETDEYTALFQQIIGDKIHLPKEPLTSSNKNSNIAMCSVVPPLTNIISQAIFNLFNVHPLLIGKDIRPNLQIHYNLPTDVGSDRIVNAIASNSMYRGQEECLIVVDMGTATVFDAIDHQGSYVGGAIAPGLVLGSNALFTKASQLKREELTAPSISIGQYTTRSIQSGLILGHASLIEGMVAKFRNELGGKSKIIGTGGLLNLILPASSIFDVVAPNLAMDGLRIAYEAHIDHS